MSSFSFSSHSTSHLSNFWTSLGLFSLCSLTSPHSRSSFSLASTLAPHSTGSLLARDFTLLGLLHHYRDYTTIWIKGATIA
ncbi:hypothetical protein Syun_014719 [Stephania yunnanensis]|uniref:Uncharacterized protein n=1 Tax=Stephania yunnanensis TaxID=152371 RepID=A0AAP0JK66_9MAGN